MSAAAGLSGLGALAACTTHKTQAITEPVRATQPVTLPPTTITTTLTPTTTTTLPARLTQPLPPLIRTGPAERANVAVTIDDIFGPGGADQLHSALDLARDRKVQLSFFPTGGAIEAHIAAGKGDVWERVVSEGHEIGNHTYTHRALTSLSDQEIRDEELGYSMVMWSIDSANTAGHDGYLAKIMGSVRNGSMILLHFQTFGLASLASLLTRLSERGLTPLTVTDLFKPVGVRSLT